MQQVATLVGWHVSGEVAVYDSAVLRQTVARTVSFIFYWRIVLCVR